MKGKNGWYWAEGFKGIKYANIVISRLDAATFKDEAERNAVLGGAYFHRSYRYYKLTHQFGNVPWLSEEITQPKLDFYSYDRWSILEQCKRIWSLPINGFRNRWIAAGLIKMLAVCF